MRKLSSNMRPMKSRPSMRADRRIRAVAGDHLIGADLIGALGRLDCSRTPSVSPSSQTRSPGSCRAMSTGAPSACNARSALDQIMLEIILLEIDEGRALVAALGQQVEARTPGARRNRPCRASTATPFSTIGSPQPSRSRISSGRLAKQIAREPEPTRSLSSSTTTRRRVARDRSRRRARPARRRRRRPYGARDVARSWSGERA